MLVAGCSHTSGSEIDGNEDSVYNRNHSYGNQLAVRVGYKPLNIAEPGSTNSTIARSILQWFNEQYDKDTMDVFVLVGWTEVTRMECPWNRPSHYESAAPHNNYFANFGKNFLRINMGWEGSYPEEKQVIKEYHQFMVKNEKYLEIASLNTILQMQYFFNSMDINYLMCNTMHLLDNVDKFNSFYIDLIDQRKYYCMIDNKQSFYPKYKDLGYVNMNAKYWHHGIEPHTLYAHDLYYFMESQDVYSKMVQEFNQGIQVPQEN